MGRKRKINDLELIYLHGLGLTQQQMADRLEVTRSTVTHALSRIKQENPDILKLGDVGEFRVGESDQLAMIRQLVLTAMRQKVLKMNLSQISFQQLAVLYGTIFDKDRLLRGEATEHVAHVHKQLDKEDKKLLQETIRKMTERALTQSSEQAIQAESDEVGDSTEDE
jgi:transcriptional regulator with XRE-family HTH domain